MEEPLFPVMPLLCTSVRISCYLESFLGGSTDSASFYLGNATLFSLNKRTGGTNWRLDVAVAVNNVYSNGQDTPALSIDPRDGTIIATLRRNAGSQPNDATFVAINPTNGQVKWTTTTPGLNPYSDPAVYTDNGEYISCAYRGTYDNQAVDAGCWVFADTGALRRNATGPLQAEANSEGKTAYSILSGILYMGQEDEVRRLTAIRPSTGEVLWMVNGTYGEFASESHYQWTYTPQISVDAAGRVFITENGRFWVWGTLFSLSDCLIEARRRR
jgi:outer membrane protein assembly factor BamB